jgi:hypothetical protein
VRPGGLSQLETPRPSILYRSAPANCATAYPAFGLTLLFEAYESNGGSSGGCPVARMRDKWRNVHRALGFWRVRSLPPFFNESFQFSPKAVTTFLSAWGDTFRPWTICPTLRCLQHYLQLYNVEVSYFMYSSREERGFLISGTCSVQWEIFRLPLVSQASVRTSRRMQPIFSMKASQMCVRRFLDAFAELPKATISCPSVRPSVRMEQLCSLRTNFHESWYLSIFKKSDEKIKV